MGVHTWFYKDRDTTPMEEVEGLHDLFRFNRDGIVLTSYKQTLEFIDTYRVRVNYEELQEFWNKYPNGLITFG